MQQLVVQPHAWLSIGTSNHALCAINLVSFLSNVRLVGSSPVQAYDASWELHNCLCILLTGKSIELAAGKQSGTGYFSSAPFLPPVYLTTDKGKWLDQLHPADGLLVMAIAGT